MPSCQLTSSIVFGPRWARRRKICRMLIPIQSKIYISKSVINEIIKYETWNAVL